MNSWGWSIVFLSLLCAVWIGILSVRRTQKTMDTIEQMLDQAMKGEFSENSFDESRLSALENRFAQFFLASFVSTRRVAEEKDKIKTLITDISHQTKTPISNLLLYCELLKEEPLPVSARDSAQAVYVQADKLRFLIDSLVKLSRLENGIIALDPQRQEIGPILESVVGQFVFSAEKKGLYLRSEDTKEKALLDAKWTAEALVNIIDNAVKYTEHGGITVSVISYDMFVRINISDTGAGIPEEEQAEIFQRFYRGETVREKDGVGIGLYLAREIISGEGGYIKVTSAGKEGTTFAVAR